MSYLYRIFLKGLLTILPIAITVYFLVWIARLFESFFGGPLRNSLPDAELVPGVGLLFGLVLIFVVGLLVNNYLAHGLIQWFEGRLAATPVISAIYNPIRDITQLFAKNEKASGSQKVVLVKPYGADGAEVLGLVTRDAFQDLHLEDQMNDRVAVFIPFSYAMGGTTVIVSRMHIRDVAIDPDRAMQLALTAWIKSTKEPETKTL